MNRFFAFSIPALAATFLMIPVSCVTHYVSNPTGPTATGTPRAPQNSPTVTETPGCASYSDHFGGQTLSNYVFFDAGTQSAGTASGEGYTITGGYLEDISSPTTGGLAIVKNALFNNSLSDYTVEADFEMDSYQGGLGVFGIAFRTGSNGSFYCFQWNGDFSNADGGTHDWELEKNTGSPSVSFTYPACCVTAPGYTLGTWVHLKVAAAGDNYKCYVNFNDGAGDHLIFNATDSSSPYTSGGVGVRTYGINSPNVARIANFFVNAQSCVPAGTPTASVTPTTTSASATPTSTPTSTPNVTPTTTCVGTTYSDNFSVNSLGNYSVYDGDWNPSTATAQSIQIVSGEFQVAPTSGVVYPYTIVNDSSFSQSLGDYRVEGDFKLDTVGPGVFGVIVRATAASAYGYIFQWNGLNNRWEIEKQIAPGNYYYPATNASSAYTQGTWVHLKLVAGPGNLFNAYITPSGGAQQQIFSGVTDPGTTTPYATGGAGIRAYNVVGGNILHVQNFIASTCP